MDGQMHDVETYIGNIGQKCNTRILEKKAAKLQTWSRIVGTAGEDIKPRTLCAPRIAWMTNGR